MTDQDKELQNQPQDPDPNSQDSWQEGPKEQAPQNDWQAQPQDQNPQSGWQNQPQNPNPQNNWQDPPQNPGAQPGPGGQQPPYGSGQPPYGQNPYGNGQQPYGQNPYGNGQPRQWAAALRTEPLRQRPLAQSAVSRARTAQAEKQLCDRFPCIRDFRPADTLLHGVSHRDHFGRRRHRFRRYFQAGQANDRTSHRRNHPGSLLHRFRHRRISLYPGDLRFYEGPGKRRHVQ